jgi:uracil-DNA glycosylase
VVPETALIVLCGQYAQRYYLGRSGKRNLTETVRSASDYLPRYFPLPHPSWRSKIWMKKNPWFAEEILPMLRDVVRAGESE